MALFAKWLESNVGSTTTPITSAKADANFMGFYVSNSDATGGTARGLYMRLYLTGAGQSGESIRAFTTANAAGAVGIHGIHASLSFGTSGMVTGEGAAARATLQIPNRATLTGTVAANLSEIWSDGSSSSPAATTLCALHRYALTGNATGISNADAVAALFSLEGVTINTGNIVEASTTEANYSHSIRIKINGTNYYLMAAASKG